MMVLPSVAAYISMDPPGGGSGGAFIKTSMALRAFSTPGASRLTTTYFMTLPFPDGCLVQLDCRAGPSSVIMARLERRQPGATPILRHEAAYYWRPSAAHVSLAWSLDRQPVRSLSGLVGRCAEAGWVP